MELAGNSVAMERIRAESISFMLLMSTEKIHFVTKLSRCGFEEQICSVGYYFYNATFITIAVFLMFIYQAFHGD